ncbi:MAG TPA: hypothetical protein PLB97_03135 [Accumulibacter sp.]|nr:hypothetical protein [Accumulibacter sp.]HPP46858.1 hypothetical protein [Accumulibacter sp.]
MTLLRSIGLLSFAAGKKEKYASFAACKGRESAIPVASWQRSFFPASSRCRRKSAERLRRLGSCCQPLVVNICSEWVKADDRRPFLRSD